MATEILTSALKVKTHSTWVQNFARKQVLARLTKLQKGHLTLIENGKKYEFGSDKSFAATVTVNDAHFYGEIAFGGSIGAGEAYMLGYWNTNTIPPIAASRRMISMFGSTAFVSKVCLRVRTP